LLVYAETLEPGAEFPKLWWKKAGRGVGDWVSTVADFEAGGVAAVYRV
jgi:hypothetical protein